MGKHDRDSFNHEIIISWASILIIIQMFWNCFFQVSNIELINTVLLYSLAIIFGAKVILHTHYARFFPTQSLSPNICVELRKYVSLLGEFVNTCQCLEILSLVSSKESFGKIPKDYVVIYHRTTILYCKYLYLGDVFARNHARSYQWHWFVIFLATARLLTMK